MEPGRVLNRIPEATRAENCETLIFDDSTTGPKWVPNRIFDVEAFRKLLESLLNGSWSHLESSWRPLGASWTTILGAQDPSGGKPTKRTGAYGPLAAGNSAPRGGGKGEGILWKSLPLRGEVVSQPAIP